MAAAVGGFSVWNGSRLQGEKATAEATEKLQNGDAAGAAKILEQVTKQSPASADAWRILGAARLKLKKLDEAATAFRNALDLGPESPRAMYGLADVFAAQGNNDRSIEWLRKAQATHRIDMTFIDADPNLEGLRQDPRVRELLPKPEDFTKPFVEPVKVLREWDGEAANDQFGWIARNIGDVDGDGINDVVTSAPTSNKGAPDAGRIYVYSTGTGKLLWTADGQAGDELGTGVEGAGDVNHDGVPDVVAGAPGGGKAYVYSGKNGQVLLTLRAEHKDDNFGRHVSGAGDIDRDGYADVIVGAPGNSAAGKEAGRAYVYSGRDGHLLLTLTGERAGDNFGSTVAGYSDAVHTFLVVGAPAGGPKKTGRTYVYDGLSQKPKFAIDSDESGDALGAYFVSVVGDVDGDGVPDIYASDWSNKAKGFRTGRIYVHSGRDGHRLLTLTGETAGEGFGIGPATAGDVDRDGHSDLIVGSWQYGEAAVSGGRAYLYSGKDGRLLKTYTCRVPGDTFGFDAVGMGDIDGDGTIDFLITSAWSGIHGYHSGRMFIISSGIAARQ